MVNMHLLRPHLWTGQRASVSPFTHEMLLAAYSWPLKLALEHVIPLLPSLDVVTQ